MYDSALVSYDKDLSVTGAETSDWCVALKSCHGFPVVQVPHLERVIGRGRDHLASVGRQGQGRDPTGVPREHTHQWATRSGKTRGEWAQPRRPPPLMRLFNQTVTRAC